jgi:hypothetical protein
MEISIVTSFVQPTDGQRFVTLSGFLAATPQ